LPDRRRAPPGENYFAQTEENYSAIDSFQLLPRRWVVERTLAWLNRNRRLAKDFEASVASATTWIYIAAVQLIVRRMTWL
jgi:transposase